MYIAKQLTGDIASAIESSALSEFQKASAELEYMRNLSIETAEADVLYQIGLLAGIPWPICPEGTFATNRFTFITESDYPLISDAQGFGSVDTELGGLLSSVNADSSVMCPIGQYRTLIKIVATIRREGMSTKALDDLVHTFSPGYQSYILGSYDRGETPGDNTADPCVTFLLPIATGPLYIIQTILDLFSIEFPVYISLE